MNQKANNNPMQSHCGAKTRRGIPCPSYPVHGSRRCRMHGGKGSGAPQGNRNAWKHGLFSAEAIRQRREAKALIRQWRQFQQMAYEYE